MKMIRQTTTDEDIEFTEFMATKARLMQPEYDLGKVLFYIQAHFYPEEVFSPTALNEWAIRNDYRK